jgi:trigger factor
VEWGLIRALFGARGGIDRSKHRLPIDDADLNDEGRFLMSSDEFDDAGAAEGSTAMVDALSQAEMKPKLDMKVAVNDVGACKKHVKITISRNDIERQFAESVGAFGKDASVPGFRKGHAPTQLIQRRFRKEVSGQVKSALLLASLEQLEDEQKIRPISQPQIDIEAIELPDLGPFEFEFDVEVQPEFPLPDYKNLTIKRPIRVVHDSDIDVELKKYIERFAQVVPKLEGGVAEGDYVTANITFLNNGAVRNEVRDVNFRVFPELRFTDGFIPDLAKAIEGAKIGESRITKAEIGSASADEAIRGQSIDVSIEILDIKTVRLPEVDAAFLDRLGFDSLEEFRTAIRSMLERRYKFQQEQAIRHELFNQLYAQHPFEMPAEMIAGQMKTAIERRVIEMQSAGLSEREIRNRSAEIRSFAHETTLRDLKEYFILSRIAEVENVKVEESDIDDEIELIADQSDQSIRRVRAQIEKEGRQDALAAQILERKTIARILEFVKFEDVELIPENKDVETLDESAASAEQVDSSSAPDHSSESADA